MSEYFTWGYRDFQNFETVMAIGRDNYSELFGFPYPYQIPVCPNYGNYDDISQPISIPNPSGSSGSTTSIDSSGYGIPFNKSCVITYGFFD